MVCCLPGSDISATWFVQLKDGSALLAFCLFVFMCRTYPSILWQKNQNPWSDQACRVLLCPCISLQRPWACTEFIFILNIICASLETATSAHRCIHREHLSAALQKSFFVKGRAQSCPTALETFQFYFILFLFSNLVVKCLLLHSGGWGNGA